MKDGRFDEELRKTFGNDASLLLKLKQYPDRARIEAILSNHKNELRQGNGKIRNLKKTADRRARKAVEVLLQPVSAPVTATQPEVVGENFSVTVSAATYVDRDPFNPAMVIALLQESIDTETEEGMKEWKMLEAHTSSNQSVEGLLQYLKLWMEKLGIKEPTSSNWVDTWKLYYARKSASVIVPSKDHASRRAAMIATHMDAEHDYGAKTITEYLLALTTGEDEGTLTAYIRKETDTPEKLKAFALAMIDLATKCDAPHPEDTEDAAPTPVSVLLAAAAQMLFFKVKHNNLLASIGPVPGQRARVKDRDQTSDMFQADDCDRGLFIRNEDGTLTEFGAAADHSERKIFASQSTNYLRVMLGGGETGTGESLDEATGVHEHGFASMEPTDAPIIEVALGTDSDPSIDTSGVWLANKARSEREETPIEGVSLTTVVVPTPEKLLTKPIVKATRSNLRSVLAFGAPFAALALSSLLAFAGAGRPPRLTTTATTYADVYQGQRAPVVTTPISATADQIAPELANVASPVHIGYDLASEQQRLPTWIFHTGPVLPQGINTCILGGAKNILRTQFGIVGESRLEQIAGKAEDAIRSVRSSTLHTKPGDEVALAYDNLSGFWTVRQMRHGTIVAEALFESPIMEAFPTNSYLKPNLFTKLSNKVRGWWDNFKGFFA